MSTPSPREVQKERAALKAVEHVRSGTLIGLGTGSTAKYAIEAIGRRLADGQLQNIRAVATSEASAALAQAAQIPLVDLGPNGVDLAIDGMDEVDPHLGAIKGLGGALTREKMVAVRAKTFILIGDDSKQVERLGAKAPLPVEVLRFGLSATEADLAALGCRTALRKGADGNPFVSDNGHYVVDCHFDGGIDDPHALAARLDGTTGVVEHGLFLEIAERAYVATEDEVLELTQNNLTQNNGVRT
ncbi:MAG: ribose 5-phosphate isomerase A [Trueperaceae bacterium]|nr:ribose 5-phosphate isomerase A [Trueperaceae bacterium]